MYGYILRYFLNILHTSILRFLLPLNESHLDAMRGAYLTKMIQPVNQQEELVGAILVGLIRANESS